MTRPFDYVDWHQGNGELRRLLFDEFLAIPLRVRVRGLLRGEFTFHDAAGVLPSKEALARLAKISAKP